MPQLATISTHQAPKSQPTVEHDQSYKGLFIGWSEPASKKIARYLARWFKDVLPELKPFMSEDLPKGKRWFEKLCSKLASSSALIIIVTKHNKNNSWIIFEAGAVGAHESKHVAPLLIDASINDLSGGPLEHFQATVWERSDFCELLKELGAVAGLTNSDVEHRFQKNWPRIATNINKVLKEYSLKLTNSPLPAKKIIASKSSKPQPIQAFTYDAFCTWMKSKFPDKEPSEKWDIEVFSRAVQAKVTFDSLNASYVGAMESAHLAEKDKLRASWTNTILVLADDRYWDLFGHIWGDKVHSRYRIVRDNLQALQKRIQLIKV